MTNKARAALIVPRHLGRDVLRKQSSSVQSLWTARDSNTASLVRGYATAIVNAYNAIHSGATAPQPVQAEIRLWYNPVSRARSTQGRACSFSRCRCIAPLLASLAMAKEGEKKTILQVYVSSISAHEFLLGKILAFTLVGLAECIPLLVLLHFYFGLSFVGDPSSFVVATVLYSFCVASFGIMVGAAIPAGSPLCRCCSWCFLWSFCFPPDLSIDNIPIQIRWTQILSGENITYTLSATHFFKAAVGLQPGWKFSSSALLALCSTRLRGERCAYASEGVGEQIHETAIQLSLSGSNSKEFAKYVRDRRIAMSLILHLCCS